MHSVRRAALRAACSSSRFIAVPRPQVATIGMPISKAIVRPAGVLPVSRYFSQTARVAAEENPFGTPAEEEADASAAAEAEAETGAEESGFDAPVLKSSPTEQQLRAQNSASIFISNMTFEATDAHLTEAFDKYGEILEVRIARDGRGMSRGFGFITFSSAESANKAVNEANNSFWHGRRINVDHRKTNFNEAERPSINEPTTSLYIGNIPYEASDADLNKMFRSLDNIKDVRVAVDRNTGWPRGFAHADFHDLESAVRAHDRLKTVVLSGRNLRIDYADAKRVNQSRRD